MEMELWSGNSFVANRIIRFDGFSYEILVVFSFSEQLGFTSLLICCLLIVLCS
jgi:hypothetical protein